VAELLPEEEGHCLLVAGELRENYAQRRTQRDLVEGHGGEVEAETHQINH